MHYTRRSRPHGNGKGGNLKTGLPGHLYNLCRWMGSIASRKVGQSVLDIGTGPVAFVHSGTGYWLAFMNGGSNGGINHVPRHLVCFDNNLSTSSLADNRERT